jgi:cell wall-associated NlpC family hydrolase
MTANLRLLLIVFVLVYSAAFGPGAALGAGKKAHAALRPKGQWLRLHKTRERRLAAPKPVGVRAVQFARNFLGVPYSWGGSSPRTGFDCSGFVRFVYARFGLELPHSSYADYDLGVRVARGALRPGDLVFFDGVGHVGMYVGDGRFIHAPHSGTDVQVTSLSDPWYRSSYVGARRLFVHHAHRVSLGGSIRKRLRLF